MKSLFLVVMLVCSSAFAQDAKVVPVDQRADQEGKSPNQKIGKTAVIAALLPLAAKPEKAQTSKDGNVVMIDMASSAEFEWLAVYLDPEGKDGINNLVVHKGKQKIVLTADEIWEALLPGSHLDEHDWASAHVDTKAGASFTPFRFTFTNTHNPDKSFDMCTDFCLKHGELKPIKCPEPGFQPQIEKTK